MVPIPLFQIYIFAHIFQTNFNQVNQKFLESVDNELPYKWPDDLRFCGDFCPIGYQGLRTEGICVDQDLIDGCDSEFYFVVL